MDPNKMFDLMSWFRSISKLNPLCLFWQPFCSLHLHLDMPVNPYLPGRIFSKDSAPGIIVATGRTEAEKVYTA